MANDTVSASAMTLLAELGHVRRELDTLKAELTALHGEISELTDTVLEAAASTEAAPPSVIEEQMLPMLMQLLQRPAVAPAPAANGTTTPVVAEPSTPVTPVER